MTFTERIARSYVEGEMRRCIVEAEKARARYFARKDEIRQDVAYEFITRPRPLPTPESSVVDSRAADDPKAKAAGSDNRWFLEQTTAYGTCRTVELLEKITAQQAKIIELLGQLVGKP